MMIRQGDVLLTEIPNAKEVDEEEFLREKGYTLKDNKIISFGSATGNSHRFESEDVTVYINENFRDGSMIVKIDKEAELIHDEHENLLIPPGYYSVIKQVNLDLEDNIQRVID